MLKILAIAVLGLALAGCKDAGPSSSNRTTGYVLPDALKKCTVYKLIGDSSNSDLHVVHCPNAETTTKYSTGGKHSRDISTTILDGV